MTIPSDKPLHIIHHKSTQIMQTIQWIGIDVSYENLKIAWLGEHSWEVLSIANTLEGILAWIATLDRARVHIVVEATGTYSAKIIYALHQAGLSLSVITPRQASQFAGVLKNITKNDERDACALCLFGQHMNPPLYEAPSEAAGRLRQLRTLLAQLKKQRQALSNERHALLQLPNPLPLALDCIGQTLYFLDTQIQSLEKEICALAADQFSQLSQKITTVNGIGPKTALALLVATDGLKHFTDVKQLAKFVGLSPTERQSGKSLHAKGHINRAADPELRSLFYMATWSACKSNKACIELRKKLKNKGKPPKVILIALAHKLLRQVWGVVKNNTPFDNDFEAKVTAV